MNAIMKIMAFKGALKTLTPTESSIRDFLKSRGKEWVLGEINICLKIALESDKIDTGFIAC